MTTDDKRVRRARVAMLEAMMSRRRAGQVALAAALAAGVGSAGAAGGRPSARVPAGGQNGEPSRGGQIIVAQSGQADSLNPHETIAAVASLAFTNIYQTLVGRNRNLEYEGILAERWEISEDGREYTFFLRPGVKFHDGTDLNADAVKFTFDRILDPALSVPSRSWISPLERVEVVDPATVKFFLTEPFSPMLGNMSGSGYFGILSPTAVQARGEEFGRSPVGTGAFKFKEWISGESITLERYEEYQEFRSDVENKGAPYLDGLVFRNIPEEQTQVAAFETGEINLFLLPPREVPAFEGNPDAQLFPTEGGTGIAFIEWSMLPPEGENAARFKPPFDDLRLRQAVAHAINADEIVERVLGGLAVRNYGPMPAGLPGYDPAIEQHGYRHDPEAARRLLEEAGWTGEGVRQKDGQPLEILFWTWNDSTQERLAQVIQNQLTEVGFGCMLETMEVTTLFDRQGTDDDPSNLVLTEWGWGEPDVLYMMTDTTSGIGLYRPKPFRDLVSRARVVSDLDERAAIYFEAMKVMLADAAMVPLWTNLEVTGVRAEVKGFQLGALGAYLYQDAYIEG